MAIEAKDISRGAEFRFKNGSRITVFQSSWSREDDMDSFILAWPPEFVFLPARAMTRKAMAEYLNEHGYVRA